ncbi:MAG: DUF4956 domain-containing protein [Melioribacteraceae bacterium]|nr:DUF4956 domain-containing protein [Melioribacteraceae bacterium]
MNIDNLEELLYEFLNPPNAYQALTIYRVLLSILVTFFVTLFIFYIYRKTFKGVLYTRNFNVGLVLTGMIVALITLPISSNIALSLGMVGALSIVRFRTAIKDPADIVFTFWAIAVGIICGAGLYMVAIIGSPVIGALLFILSKANFRTDDPFLLVIHYAAEAEAAVQKIIPKHKLRSRTVTAAGVELMVEVRMKTKDTVKVDEFLKIKGVKDAAIVSYNTDVS